VCMHADTGIVHLAADLAAGVAAGVTLNENVENSPGNTAKNTNSQNHNEKQELRKLRNREHAKNARRRRQEYVSALEQTLFHLQNEIAELKATNQRLMAENAAIVQQSSQFLLP